LTVVTLPLELSHVRDAAERIRAHAVRTPVLHSRSVDEAAGAEILLKAESFQRVGAFKFRGAYNAIACLAPEERAGGVCTASSGNHGQAVALAARLHGIPATVLMPGDAAAMKVAAVEAFGAEIVRYDRYAQDREELLGELAGERGLPIVHPFDDLNVAAGQGTAALELLEEHPDLDAIVTPVGGGGLISGTAVAAKALAPGIRVLGAEPDTGDHVHQSLAAGERVRIPVPRTIADGVQVPAPGVHTFPIIQALVDGILTASDEEIVAAMRLLFTRVKIVVEPSAALALAPLLAGRGHLAGRKVGVVLSGGNVDLDRFAALTG
jgi:threo-3-hydroxy-L-aspartate ammonia-lyase